MTNKLSGASGYRLTASKASSSDGWRRAAASLLYGFRIDHGRLHGPLALVAFCDGDRYATNRCDCSRQSSLRMSRQTPYAAKAHMIKPSIDNIIAHLATISSSGTRRLSNGKGMFAISTVSDVPGPQLSNKAFLPPYPPQFGGRRATNARTRAIRKRGNHPRTRLLTSQYQLAHNFA